MPETTLLSLRPTRLIALKWYVLWIFLWVLSGFVFLDPFAVIPDWRLFGFRAQSWLGTLVGVVGLLVLLRAEIKRIGIKYVVTDVRIVRHDGILRRRINEIPFNKIERIEIDQSLLQRIFRFGDIIVDTGEDTVTLASLGHVNLIQTELSKQLSQYARR